MNNVISKFIINKNSLIIKLFIIILSILYPAIAYSQTKAEIDFLIFDFKQDGIEIKIKLKDTLPEDSPEISAERIKFIDKGVKVRLIYKFYLYKEGWWFFDSRISVSNKNEIIITRTLQKDIITKIYTITETANIKDIVGLNEEITFNGAMLDQQIFKKEKLKKLREEFFEKDLVFKIKYKDVKIQNNANYYIKSQVVYKSYNPIWGSGEPGNFYTKEVRTQVKKYNIFSYFAWFLIMNKRKLIYLVDNKILNKNALKFILLCVI
ncbi:MAG: hypothetical protein ACOCV8_05110 [Spirochaetota bacterium]